MDAPAPQVSVLMPTFEQCHFIGRALDSLFAQTLPDWELIIVDDGSRDHTRRAIAPFLSDPRVRYCQLPRNTGLGHALNAATGSARAPLLAVLPSDDLYYADHLRQLCAHLHVHPQAVLAYSGMRHHYNRQSEGQMPGQPLQLVQCVYRRTALRWTERAELESDDLGRLFWDRLRQCGPFSASGSISCEWVEHPAQRHKLMREPEGGINRFRRHYRVDQPLRFHSSAGNAADEVNHYQSMRERPDSPRASDGLTILLVGELAYNAERVLALEEQGHSLHGLWIERPYWYNTVGPLPFGHVRELPRRRWRDAVRALQPDLIYAQLNWQAVPFAHQVMMAFPAIPFVWHFKEGPFICLEKGSWPQLAELFQYADGRIVSSPEMLAWFDTAIPGLTGGAPCHVLDGDLPRRAWFARPRSSLLSAADGEIHTVVPGRPIGLHPHSVALLAAQRIHLHFYGDFTHGQWREWIDESCTLAPAHLHLHGNVDQDRWVEEFSRYDAGWLHCFASVNQGEIRRADWDDLNLPARMATLAAAGLPMIQYANPGALVATKNLTQRLGIGVFFKRLEELGETLADRPRMEALRAQVWRQREHFTFDHHVPALLAFFRGVIAHAQKKPAIYRRSRSGSSKPRRSL